MEEDCSKTSSSAVAALPDDLVVEILSRVPAKSVCRFKCVSKAWRDLIADPDHRKKLRQAMQGLFFMTRLEKGHFSFSLMDLTARSMPLDDVDPSFSFLMERRPGVQNLRLLDSCNGLLLFGRKWEPPCYEEASLGYIVCNPTTKQWRAVPTCGSPRGFNHVHTYLAFDPVVSSHFHLIQFQKTAVYLESRIMSVHAYSSETGKWSHNQTEDEEQGQSLVWQNRVHLSIDRCAFVKGFLHFIVQLDSSFEQQQVLVADVQGRTRRMIRLPNVVAAARGRCWCVYFGQSQGYLHCITREEFLNYYEQRYELSIWVLPDYDAEEWVLKDTVSSVQLFGQNFRRTSARDSEVADIHLDCNVIFIFSRCEHKFIAYDMDRKKVSVFGTSKCISRLKVGHYVPHFSELPAPLK